MDRPRVTDADRDYFRRLGEFKRESHEEARRRWLELPLGERLRQSMAWLESQWPEDNEPRPDDDPTAFYARARELGMIRNEARLVRPPASDERHDSTD